MEDKCMVIAASTALLNRHDFLSTPHTEMSETYDSNVKLTLMKTSSQGSTGRELGMCAFNGGGLEFALTKPEHPSNLGHKRANMPETG